MPINHPHSTCFPHAQEMYALTNTHTHIYTETQTLHFKLQISIEASSRRLPHCSILRDENSRTYDFVNIFTGYKL